MLKDPVHLGAFVVTGERCPCSGVWLCAHEGDIEGGRHRCFQQGQQMPPAVLVRRPCLLDRLRGRQPQRRLVNTVSSLVGYAEAEDTRPMEQPVHRLEAG
jgi:hypothetical protein